ncbi:MAG TPA: type II toxin-antitoxin system VapC family toxin [Thermoanaerobaculia bacterium]|jgi:predicted nucleic-acid-binding protein
MRAVDTNVLLRLVMRDGEGQFAAAAEFVARGAWASHIVLAEVMWVLRSVYGKEHGEVADAVDILLNHADVTLQEPDVVAAALDQYRRKPSLGFSDCLILEIARKAGHLPLGTFDRYLGKLPGAHRL